MSEEWGWEAVRRYSGVAQRAINLISTSRGKKSYIFPYLMHTLIWGPRLGQGVWEVSFWAQQLHLKREKVEIKFIWNCFPSIYSANLDCSLPMRRRSRNTHTHTYTPRRIPRFPAFGKITNQSVVQDEVHPESSRVDLFVGGEGEGGRRKWIDGLRKGRWREGIGLRRGAPSATTAAVGRILERKLPKGKAI